MDLQIVHAVAPDARTVLVNARPIVDGGGTSSEEWWAGDYLHTQDVAVVAPDGAVQIVDRLKDVIKTGGE